MEQQEFIIPEINAEDLIPEDELQIEESESIEDESEDTEDEPELEEIETEDVEDDIEESSDLHVPLYKWSVDNNFFFHKSKEELEKNPPKTPQEYLELVEERNQQFDKIREQQVEQVYLSKFPEYLQPIVKAAKDSPDPIDRDTFLELVNVAEKTNIDPAKFETDETLSEDYIRQSYKSNGYDEEEIEDIVATLKDKGTINARAKSLYDRDSKKGNDVINNFINTVNSRVKEEEDNVETFKTEFSSALQNTGWRKDKLEAVNKSFSSGDYYTRLEHAINNPKVAPFLVDFLNYYDGTTIHLDKYAKHGFNATKRKIVQDIDKKSGNKYFGDKSSGRSNRNKTNDPLDKLNLNNLQIVTK